MFRRCLGGEDMLQELIQLQSEALGGVEGGYQGLFFLPERLKVLLRQHLYGSIRNISAPVLEAIAQYIVGRAAIQQVEGEVIGCGLGDRRCPKLLPIIFGIQHHRIALCRQGNTQL